MILISSRFLILRDPNFQFKSFSITEPTVLRSLIELDTNISVRVQTLYTSHLSEIIIKHHVFCFLSPIRVYFAKSPIRCCKVTKDNYRRRNCKQIILLKSRLQQV